VTAPWDRWVEYVPDVEPPDEGVPMRSPQESLLRGLDEDGLRRLHARVLRAVFAANGPRRMGLGSGVLKPIEAELRRRGLQAIFWSGELCARSNAASRAGEN
jgi:hypothetical protein